MIKIALPLMVAGLGLTVYGYNAADLSKEKHPDNPLVLKGSPLGKTISRLTNRSVDRSWEQGQMTLLPVHPEAASAKITGFMDLIQKAGLNADNHNNALNTKTHESPNNVSMIHRARILIKQQIHTGFELDPTSGPALQLTLLFLTEIDSPQNDNLVMRSQRIREGEAYIQKALDNYNLDPETGNPDHFINAADAVFARYLLHQTLNPAFGIDNPLNQNKRVKMKEEIATHMKPYLQGALDIQKTQERRKQWDNRSNYRKQDFWAALQFTNRVAKSLDADVRASNEQVAEDRFFKTPPSGTKKEREIAFQKFSEKTFGKKLKNLFCGDCGVDHAPGEGH